MHPTIAVITAHYFEKVAVDAVMTNKQTFVRYATVGKSKLLRNGLRYSYHSVNIPLVNGVR